MLNASTIVIQNISYAIAFFPGRLNSFHALLFCALCFLIWMKFHNEKSQRKVFLLQEKEKEWRSFVRDVLPSSVIMLRFDKKADEIKIKLVNRASQKEYSLHDEIDMKNLLRTTKLRADTREGKTRSVSRSNINKGSNVNLQNRKASIGSETLENFIYNRFKEMVSPKTPSLPKTESNFR